MSGPTAIRPRPISGLGPHGEHAAGIDQVVVSDEVRERALRAHFTVALVVHSSRSEWSTLQVAGIRAALARFDAELVDVVECGFQVERQAAAMEVLVERRPDAIISIPVDNRLASDAHRKIGQADIKLVLMDNAPLGMVARKDYVSVVSADNFGNGEIAAELLAGHVREGGTACAVRFSGDFYATHERNIGFRKWMREHRPDVRLMNVDFEGPDQAGARFLDDQKASHEADALFVDWDEPAMAVASACRAAGRQLPTTTIDLGSQVATEIARGDVIVGLGAQLPYDQGMAEATAAIIALAGSEPPPWIVVPPLAVTRENLIDAYEAVWHRPAPDSLRRLTAG